MAVAASPKLVDQVGEQRNAARGDEDEQLQDGRDAKHDEREADGAQAFARALDRLVHEAVAVAVAVVVGMVVVVIWWS
ncbi:hypothetical protein BH20ACT16_BH20ACT16_01720 [soil metagenome]|jgi:ElaB/YqjD/DUF883 family membrane-anchored ribosome-binding protein